MKHGYLALLGGGVEELILCSPASACATVTCAAAARAAIAAAAAAVTVVATILASSAFIRSPHEVRPSVAVLEGWSVVTLLAVMAAASWLVSSLTMWKETSLRVWP